MRKAQGVHSNPQLTTSAPTQERAWQPPYFRRYAVSDTRSLPGRPLRHSNMGRSIFAYWGFYIIFGGTTLIFFYHYRKARQDKMRCYTKNRVAPDSAAPSTSQPVINGTVVIYNYSNGAFAQQPGY